MGEVVFDEAAKQMEQEGPACLFAIEKIGGTWTLVKACSSIVHLTGLDVQIVDAGWYTMGAKGRLFFFAPGDNVSLNKSGNYAWMIGPWL